MKSQLFIHFQECAPRHFFTLSNDNSLIEDDLKILFQELDLFLSSIETENYCGFYDINNIQEFLKNYDVLDDYYPVSPRKKLRQSLRSWINWKSERFSNCIDEFKIENTPTYDNSFSEIYDRMMAENNEDIYLLLSHNSVCFKNRSVNVEKTTSTMAKPIDCFELSNCNNWFSLNRRPNRVYHPSLKHGENGRGAQTINGKRASSLLCSHSKAEEMLHKAIGINGLDELFYYDEINEAHIIFRYEGDIGENKYHAYHLPEDFRLDKKITKIISYIRENKEN